MFIIHSALKDEYDNEIKTGFYRKNSVEKFGYVHCSDLDTYALVAPNFKDDYHERVILVIDTDKLSIPVRWEDGGGLDFPHIYGCVPVSSIVALYPHLWSDDREWVPNDDLLKFNSDNKNETVIKTV